MAENRISYLSRNYNDYRSSIIDTIRKYYPDVFGNIDDASIGSFLVDVMADISDSLNFHIDRVYQETAIDSAYEFSSLQDLARSNGLKIPFKKAALVEVEISCEIPLTEQGGSGEGTMMADENYCPYIKMGTQFSNGSVTFEINEDVDFKTQFNSMGIPNRQIIPRRDSNGNIISYTYKKLSNASACQTKIYKKVITPNDIKPFMEIIIEDTDVLGIDGIIVKDGTNFLSEPNFSEFYGEEEQYIDRNGKTAQRFFEVDNLIDQYRFGQVTEVGEEGQINPVWKEENVSAVTEEGEPIKYVSRLTAKGEWKRIKNKFITEYTDDWRLKIMFGPGFKNQHGEIPENATDFIKYQMSKMEANDYMGVLPESGTTMYIMYKRGGGEISNIAAGSLTNIIALNMEIEGNCEDDRNSLKIRDVRRSMKVTNTTPSYGGKDEPTREEIRNFIKYNNGAQNRCVTLKDYQIMINKIPAKYGCPFRTGIIEENNKVSIYSLGLDSEGHLTNILSETVAQNMLNWLSNFKTLNDFVEIKSGKIINIAFNIVVYMDKAYDKSEVTKRLIDLVYDYMDIRKHVMGEDIFLGDLQKEISKLDGVINLVDFKCFNRHGEKNGYSDDETTQQLVDTASCCYTEYDQYTSEDANMGDEIDLKESEYILFSEANSMFEIKYKEKDIIVVVKTRN